MKLGILGGGQLAKMLALAAYPLGIRTLCLDPSSEACARDVTDVITAEFTDESALNQLCSKTDIITFETENIPAFCANFIAKNHVLYPSAQALTLAQDRLHEKSFFKSLNIPTPEFFDIKTKAALEKAVENLGMPCVLKTKRLGYDGKGQYVLKNSSDIEKSWEALQSQSLILEKFIPFEYEVSLISVRNRQGEVRFYPLIKNHHVNGILHSSEAPFDHPALQKEAENHATKILETLNYVGILTIEFFYDGRGLIVNEMAPRVHNSGHWTIEGAQTSQFENHLRAIFDLPLGSTETIGHCFLLNCIGKMLPIKSCLKIPGVHYHDYGKPPRPGRKLGHITLVETDAARYQKGRESLLSLLN